MKLITPISIIFLLLISYNCVAQKDKKKFGKATKKNTIEVYENFIKEYPRSSFSIEAKKRIAKIQFEEAVANNNTVKIVELINRNPKHDFVIEAINDLERMVGIDSTLSIYSAFVQKNLFAFMAEPNVLLMQKLEELSYKSFELNSDEYISKMTIDQLNGFLIKYPKSEFVTKVKNRKNQIEEENRKFEEEKRENAIVIKHTDDIVPAWIAETLTDTIKTSSIAAVEMFLQNQKEKGFNKILYYYKLNFGSSGKNEIDQQLLLTAGQKALTSSIYLFAKEFPNIEKIEVIYTFDIKNNDVDFDKILIEKTLLNLFQTGKTKIDAEILIQKI